jgi:hypothetical protein
MNKIILQLTAAVLLCGLAQASLFAKDSDPPEISMEGLELVEKDSRGEIYADPGVDWSVYSKINLQEATVAFRRHWQRDQNRYDPWKVKNKDVEKIKSGLAELFHEVFSEELSTNGGYTITEETGDDVMTIKPAIVDLDVYAPDTMTAGRSRSFAESAGKMTLKLEIHDSVSGDLLAKASDRREAPRYGHAQWATSVSNTAEARRMLQRWATGLRKRLDEASSSKSVSDSAGD